VAMVNRMSKQDLSAAADALHDLAERARRQGRRDLQDRATDLGNLLRFLSDGGEPDRWEPEINALLAPLGRR